VAQADSTTAAPPGGQGHPPGPPLPRRRWALWLWPAIVITLIALAGHLFGVVGAIVIAGQTVATLLFVAGDQLLDRRARSWLAVSAVGVGTIVVLLLLWQSHTPSLRRGAEHAAPSKGPVDLRGKVVTSRGLRDVVLRGALLDGAVMEKLDLTHHDLTGVSAPGISLQESDLQQVHLQGADLRGADLAGACLRNADVAGANLTGANVTGADLTGLAVPASMRKTMIGKPAESSKPIPSCHAPQ
jgi:hypothetical protein